MDNKAKQTALLSLLVFVLFWPGLMLVVSGEWLWPECWLFAAWFVLTMGIIAVYLYFKKPALLVERVRKNGSGNQKTWDKYFIISLRIVCLFWFIIMPLDAKRYRWTREFPLSVKLVGTALLLFGSVLLFLSFKQNTFLSPHVRIQSERNQQLVTNGVYRVVRHPMYLSLLLIFIGIPLLLNSFYGLVTGILMIVLLACRIIGEEKMLTQEFEAYGRYKRSVRFRLIPFVW